MIRVFAGHVQVEHDRDDATTLAASGGPLDRKGVFRFGVWS